MRKEIWSGTLEVEDVAILSVIAKREHKGNMSAALRNILRGEAERRRLWPTPQAQPEVQNGH